MIHHNFSAPKHKFYRWSGSNVRQNFQYYVVVLVVQLPKQCFIPNHYDVSFDGIKLILNLLLPPPFLFTAPPKEPAAD